jgi:hypothetical protein
MATSSAAGVPETEQNDGGGSRSEQEQEDFPHPTSSQSLISQSSSASLVSKYRYDKILGWLHYVDDNLNKVTSKHLLTLGARSEIGERVAENCKQPSEFFVLLQQRSSTDAQALARFMYALQRLGRRGKHCNKQFQTITRISPPPTDVYEENAKTQMEFSFHQCLVEICVSLGEDRNVSDRFKKFVCRYVLAVHAKNKETVAEVFLTMLKRRVISKENQDQLALALDQVGATAGLVILSHFRSQFGMDDIDIEKLTPGPRPDNVCEFTTRP